MSGEPQRRVAVLGGSFDPPHVGHLVIALAALAQLKIDGLLVVPAAQSPGKQPPQAPADERLALTRAMFEHVARARVSDIELRRGGQSRAADTLEELQTLYPDARLVLVVGSDQARQLAEGRWHRSGDLLAACDVAVARRGDVDSDMADIARLQKLTDVQLLEHPRIEVSSTAIRDALSDPSGSGFEQRFIALAMPGIEPGDLRRIYRNRTA